MSYVINKFIHGKKYAYEVTSQWISELKKVKKTNKYLGVVDDDGNIIKKKDLIKNNLILDYGDGYLIYEFIKKTNFYNVIKDTLFKICPEILPLIIYKMCYPSAMRNANIWYEGNISSILTQKLNMSSQNISEVVSLLGDEKIQRNFFLEYMKLNKFENNVIIDATSLPNHIDHSFNAWGKSDGAIEKQFRYLCVVNQETKIPLYYRFLPGNIVDISTLKNTIDELKLVGASNNYVLLDAGYMSETNIKELYKNKIDFLSRLPSDRTIYKNIINNELSDIENIKYAVGSSKRPLFAKKLEQNLYGNKGYAYVILDPTRKGKEVNEVVGTFLEEKRKKGEEKKKKAENKEKTAAILDLTDLAELGKMIGIDVQTTDISKDDEAQTSEVPVGSAEDEVVVPEELGIDAAIEYKFKKTGIMILITSKNIEISEIVSSYYMRQIVEQVFGFYKSDLDSLPIRHRTDSTIRGYLFLQFIVLIIYIQLRDKLQLKYTVEQALLLTRNLKCKIYEDKILINELTKNQREIYKLCDVLVPKNSGV